MNTKHISVLKRETLNLLKINPDGVYLDLTFGGGGHSRGILNQLRESGRLIAFDIDTNTHPIEDERFTLVNDNFYNLDCVLNKLKVKSVDGILADLGWSSDQLESIKGLSYQNESDELDMRFNENLNVKASDLINNLPYKSLKQIFMENAGVRGAKLDRFLDEILTYRIEKQINTVGDLNEIIEKIYKSESLDYMNKVYQGLRVAVNSEFDNLKEVLSKSLLFLNRGGRFLIITFHSGEEKIVKNFISRNKNIKNIIENKQMYLQPQIEELKLNIRSRSAKLWGFKKL